MSELKPCPFCGGDNVEVFRSGSGEIDRWHKVLCHNCKATGPSFHFRFAIEPLPEEGVAELSAIEAWNRRAEYENVERECIALRKEIKNLKQVIYGGEQAKLTFGVD